MNVLYDASVVAEGLIHRDRRTGIFRVAHELAVALGTRSDISLALSGARSWQATHDIGELARAGRFGRATVASASRGRLLMTTISATHASLRSALPAVEKAAAVRARTIDRVIPPLGTRDVDRFDVFHLPAHWIPTFPRGRARYIITIYDIIGDTNPEFGNRWSRAAYAEMRRSIGPRDFIITDSEWVKGEVAMHWGIAPERIMAAPLAADPRIFFHAGAEDRGADLRRLGVADWPYLLGVDRPDARKNVPGLIRAFVRAAASPALADARLVLVGAHEWDQTSLFTREAERRIARDRIVRLGYVVDEDLAALYSGAIAFVFPSLLEGFGLPALEAMQCGTPVITSNTSSLPEVVGDAGIMVDPRDVGALATAMERLVSDPATRRDFAARAFTQAGRFSWTRTADRALEAYRAALSL